MMGNKGLLTLGAAVLLAACAQQEEPTMVPMEPVYDKHGNLVVTTAPSAGAAMVESDGDGSPGASPAPAPEPIDEDPNRNRNHNQIQNENQNRNQGSG